MDPLYALALLVLLLLTAGWVARYIGGRKTAAPSTPEPATLPTAGKAIYAISRDLSSFYEESAQPADLLDNATFRAGVALLKGDDYSTDDLIAYLTGDNSAIASMAGEALRERKERGSRDRIIEAMSNMDGWPLYFALKAVAELSPAKDPIAGRVLARISFVWNEPFPRQFLKEFVADRAGGGDPLTFGKFLRRIPAARARELDSLLRHIGAEKAGKLMEEFRAWQDEHVDVDFLKSIGSIWDKGSLFEAGAIIEHEAMVEVAAELEALFLADRPRSVLLVGESGVGKTTIARLLARRLMKKGWTVFCAGAPQLVAGQIYIGQFEERLQGLIRQMQGKRRILWIVPDFPALLMSGRHKYSSIGALDMMLPHIEQSGIVVLGECQPGPFERLIQSRPRCSTAMTPLRVPAMSEAVARGLATQWMQRQYKGDSAAGDGRDTVREASNLAQQFLGHKAAPGNVLELLRLTRQRLRSAGPAGPDVIRPDDLILTLSQLTGLPSHILDEREGLDLARLKMLFNRKVKGQPEAVQCLVERVAMIKSGVTDPTRPSGVFLFAGPTGTGKTEIAKTLAEFLFSSPDRLIRLDMSEFQAIDSLERILGSTDGEEQGALVDQIRKQPFAVVLLDEFEKAHQRVWDVFLQVFDDGRLTDRRGRTADFRHAIIILTSNLGGVIPSGLGLGFSTDHEEFRPGAVTRAVTQSFRKEFLNRIDRVVVFNPLSREIMREILEKELEEVFQRRGLRSRSWAVEWDEAAVEFLMEKGFTKDLGARPLKRAVERYLLSPLAMTIVNRQVPEGDQFLFVVGSGDRLNVEFVDPDLPSAGDGEYVDADGAGEAGDAERLETMILHARGTEVELDSLRRRLETLRAQVECEGWRNDKEAAVSMFSLPDFWTSAERFEILGQYEYQDRIEAGLKRTGSLLERLGEYRERFGDRYPQRPIASLAQALYLIGVACDDVRENRPREAFLLVEARDGRKAAASERADFAARIGTMYRSWAKKRNMRWKVLAEAGRIDDRPFRLLLALSGYGAYSILQPETGLHVLEKPDGRRQSSEKSRVMVRVAPQPSSLIETDQRVLQEKAEGCFDSGSLKGLGVVRRYRIEPSPLVRDIVGGWRTGKLETVLQGDFDLIARAARRETGSAKR